MSTFNRTYNQAVATLSGQAFNNGRVSCTLETVIDFGATGNAHAANDIFNAIVIPAGYIISASGVEVLKADTAGNSGTVQLKLGATTQGSAVAPSSTGFLATVGTLTGVVASGSAAFMNAVVATGAINAVVRVFVQIDDVRAVPGTPVAIGTATTPAGATSTLYQDPISSYTTALVYVT